MTEPGSLLKAKADCEGDQEKCSNPDCPIFGTLGRESRDGKRRVRGCADKVALGRRSKRKGSSKQARAARAVGIIRSAMAPGHEEQFGGTVRVEIKSGAQVGPIDTRYRKARAQSDASKSIGDNRPFAFIAMPDGMKDGYLIVRTDDLEAVVVALAEGLEL